MKVNETKHYYEKEIGEVKELLSRLLKGQAFIEKAAKEGSVVKSLEAVQLYNKISKEVFEKLELCQFYHEFLCMDKTVVINRRGRAINLDPLISQREVEISPYHLRSMEVLKDVFGENFEEMVEFR
jgi:excinuclease UvrABC nuclease subunit